MDSSLSVPEADCMSAQKACVDVKQPAGSSATIDPDEQESMLILVRPSHEDAATSAGA